MGRFTWFVYTNCTPGDDDGFNDWYDNIHVPDLLRVPGVVACRRGMLSLAQAVMEGEDLVPCGPERIDARYRYVARYSIETDDIEAVLEEIMRRANTEAMPMSPTLAEAYTVMYEDRSA